MTESGQSFQGTQPTKHPAINKAIGRNVHIGETSTTEQGIEYGLTTDASLEALTCHEGTDGEPDQDISDDNE